MRLPAGFRSVGRGKPSPAGQDLASYLAEIADRDDDDVEVDVDVEVESPEDKRPPHESTADPEHAAPAEDIRAAKAVDGDEQ
jgi:uracil-DNA glycosylase